MQRETKPPRPLPDDEFEAELNQPVNLEDLSPSQRGYQGAYAIAQGKAVQEYETYGTASDEALAAELGGLDGRADILRRILTDRRQSESEKDSG